MEILLYVEKREFCDANQWIWIRRPEDPPVVWDDEEEAPKPDQVFEAKKAGYYITDLDSAQRWAREAGIRGRVVGVEFICTSQLYLQ